MEISANPSYGHTLRNRASHQLFNFSQHSLTIVPGTRYGNGAFNLKHGGEMACTEEAIKNKKLLRPAEWESFKNTREREPI